MYPVHTFFFSNRSVYLLVLNSRKEETPDHWLEMITSYGKDAKILVILNQQDENPDHDLNRVALREKYPNIVDFYPLSCRKRKDFQSQIDIFMRDFKKTLEDAGHVRSEIPKNWLKLKDDIPNRLKTKDFISYDNYHDLCEKFGIDEEEREILLTLLNNLGILLHYPDEGLRYTQIINPKWVTEAVYAFLHDERIIERKGYYYDKDFHRVLKGVKKHEYPEGHRPYIRYIMEKFALSYKFKDGEYVLPVLLKDNTPENSELPFLKEAAIRVRLSYPAFFPDNLIPKFICLTHGQIHKKQVWKTGVVLRDGDSETHAFIQADAQAKIIDIFVHGQDKRGYLSYIRKIFANQIHSKMGGLKVEEKIPLPDRTPENETVWVDYKALVTHLQKQWTYRDGTLAKEYDVLMLLEGIEHRDAIQEQVRRGDITIQAIANAQADSRVDISITLRCTALNTCIGEFNYIKEELLRENPALREELERFDKHINAVDTSQEKDEIVRTGIFRHIKNFLKALQDENSAIGKTVKGMNRLADAPLKFAALYEKITSLFGIMG